MTAVEDPHGNVHATTYDAHTLLVTSSTDPLGNTTAAEHDYRVLGPWQITDPNGNRSQVAFDVLGLVERSAVMGKVGDSDGDTLDDPTTTFEYDLFAWRDTGKPNWARSRVRETHRDLNTRWLEQRTYFSGAGATVMVKAQARPGLAPQRDQNGALVLDQDGAPILADTGSELRWIGNGRVVRDNKGNVIKAYEPYYSSTPDFEDEAELVEQGVTAIDHYDPLGRLIRTDFPNGTFSRVEFPPWTQVSWDANDTVLDSDWYAERNGYQGQDVPALKERRAAQLAAAHANTPTTVHLDSLGRAFLSVAHNKDAQDAAEFLETRSVLDIQGNILDVIDARGNSAETRVYGMLGQALHVASVDAGDRRQLADALGQPMRSWDSRDQRISHTYDALRRPVDRTVSVNGGPEKLLSRVVYGEHLDDPTTTNHRGRVYRAYDGAGVATTTAFDFRGHALGEQRQLVASKTTQPDWSPLLSQTTIPAMATAAAPLLDAEVFSASNARDALGRVLTAVSPDDSIVSYTYDDGGNLKRVDLDHHGDGSPQTVVGEITYNARGQRERVIYGPVDAPTTTTTYSYDPKTYRLAHLTTLRANDQVALQGLHYHYDPAGNVTDIRDTAQPTVYFQNAVVEAANAYTYDALYRLVEATGREHASQGTTQRTHEQLPIGPQPMTSDPSAMRRYTQRYAYDAVGNILTMQHLPASGAGWTRRYRFADDGNRLLATSAPGDAQDQYSHAYTYDAHGSMTTMPHLAAMDWNHDDRLRHATAGAEDVYFQYAGGIRSRKYTQKPGATTEERIYLGPFEIYRKRINGTIDLERESLHISDGSGRICLVETKTVEDEAPVVNPTPIWRYQLNNHLGSAQTEVTETGAIISYEEYHPYGTSAYRSVDGQLGVPARRYRYTGMERDEETGLGYHTARYYAPWLGRWTAPDPTGLGDGLNRFSYCHARPLNQRDPSGEAGNEDDGVIHFGTYGTYASCGYAPLALETPEFLPGDAGGEIDFSGDDEDLIIGDPVPAKRLESKEAFLARKSHQNAMQDQRRVADLEARIATQRGRELSFVDLTTYGSIRDARENVENAVDAAALGETGLAVRQGAWAVLNTGLSILDVVTLGRASGTKAATEAVVRAEGRQTARAVSTSSGTLEAGGTTRVASGGTPSPATPSAAEVGGGLAPHPADRPDLPGGYRGRYQAAAGHEGIERLPEDWDVHHSIPQELRDDPRLVGIDIDSPVNLRGVRGSRSAPAGPTRNVHQHITNEWADFLAKNPNATREEILGFRDYIDYKYGFTFWDNQQRALQ